MADSVRVYTALATAAMAFAMLPPFLLGTFAPLLIAEFGISRPLLGVLVTAGYGVAAALSLVVGQAVDAVGARRATMALFGISTCALALFASAPHYAVLVVTVALGGLPQALANPATNKMIAGAVPPERRGTLIGIKQSGVQLGTFAAGLPLAGLAEASDWRTAVWVAAGSAAAGCAAAWFLPADPRAPRKPVLKVTLKVVSTVWWLLGFSVLLGTGLAAVNTYVVLYATQELGVGVQAAGTLLAVLGIVGVVGRIGWSRLVSRGRAAGRVLMPLGIGAALATVVLLGADFAGAGWAWVAVLGIGAFAVAANAVTMLAVTALSAPEHLGRNSALVSAGFFAGLAAGPPLFAWLVDAGGYSAGWLLVAAEFALAGVVGWLWPRIRDDGGNRRAAHTDS
ncbi:MAG: MFS transporter [Kibdelosporangium sp.]